MEAALYTYGGGHVLYKIYNGIAAIVNHDSFWNSYVLIPSMIGLAWAAVLALSRADLKYFGAKWFIPAFVFIEVLLVPSSSLHIVDEVDPTFGYDKVDGLPQGLVAIVSYSSLVSRSLTEMMEDMYAPSQPEKMSKTGYAFSSRLMKEARTARISDPRIRENVKAWANQCVWLPYLKTNIRGKRESVRNSEDLITWVEGNGHPSLGIYWQHEDGTQEYKTCRAAAPVIREAMAVEGRKGLRSIQKNLFGMSPKGVDSSRLNTMMQETWQMVLNSTRSAHQQVQQMMLVNAHKEAVDDHREQANYSRIHPELVSMNATRALEAQSMTGLMNSMISGATMPLIQATLTALFSLVFILILPFFFLPGGLQRFMTWVKIVMSLQLWPVFSSILNAISIMWYGNSTEGILDGYSGFSIATTTGLADSAWYVSTWAAGLQMMVPALAWAVLSGSQYAVTSMVSGFTSSLERRADSYATESTDGNVSMGNFNMMNETLASKSIAQQSHFGNQNFAETLNTGSQVMTTAANGTMYTTQSVSQLATSFSSNDALRATASEQARESQQLMEANGKVWSQSVRGASSDMLSLADKHSRGVNIAKGLKKEEAANFNQSLEEFRSAADSFSKKHGISTQTGVTAAIGFDSSRTLVGGAASKLSGFSIRGEGTGNALNQESIDKALNSDEGKRLQESIQKLQSFGKSHSSQLTDAASQDAVRNISGNIEKAKSSADNFNTSYTKSQNWEKLESFGRDKGFTVTANENDAWTEFVSQRTGRSKADVPDYLTNSANSNEVTQLQSEFVGYRQEQLQSFVENAGHVLSDREIQNWQSKVPDLNPVGEEFYEPVRTEIAKQQFKAGDELRAVHSDLQRDIDLNIDDVQTKQSEENAGLNERNTMFKNQHGNQHKMLNDDRLGNKIYRDTFNKPSSVTDGESLNDTLPKKG